MIYLLVFILELGILFFLSKKLINALTSLLYKIGKSHTFVVHTLAIIFLPGTIVHELAHLLVAGVMFIPVGELSVMPEIEGESVKLGSVQIGQSDPFRRTLVGVAPVLIGILAILGILYFLSLNQSFIWWQVALSLYLVFEIGNTMFSSKKDLEGVIGFVLAILIVALFIFGGLYFLNQNLYQSLMQFLANLDYRGVIEFFKRSSLYLLVPLVLDLGIIILTKPFRR